MKKTVSAVKYGMRVLKLTPDELFKLIESSNGYSGDDYARWLASKIIEVSEADGVQFSQLLVKKFNIINEILESATGEQKISEGFLDIFKNSLNKDLYSVGFEEIDRTLEVDWYKGIDLDNENSFFAMQYLPEELQNKLLEDESFSIIMKLSLEPSEKKSDLYLDAKGKGLSLQSKGAMMLYRLCMLVDAFALTKVKFGVLCPVKFLYDNDNLDIIDYLQGVFKVSEGYSMKSVEMSLNALNAGDMAYIVLEPRQFEEECQDGIVLTSISLSEDEPCGFEEKEVKRYSHSRQSMLNKISEESVKLRDDMMMQSLGNKTSWGKGYQDALGYMNLNGTVTLSTLPEEGKTSIAITEDNIKDIIAYFGVTVSRETQYGYQDDLPCLMDGMSDYDELLYNCLPLFLFDYQSGFKDMGIEKHNGKDYRFKNNFSLENSDVVDSLLDVGLPYFSYEAKEVFNLCKDFIEFMNEKGNYKNLSFQELRACSDDTDINKMYEDRLLKLKETICLMSKRFM